VPWGIHAISTWFPLSSAHRPGPAACSAPPTPPGEGDSDVMGIAGSAVADGNLPRGWGAAGSGVARAFQATHHAAPFANHEAIALRIKRRWTWRDRHAAGGALALAKPAHPQGVIAAFGFLATMASAQAEPGSGDRAIGPMAFGAGGKAVGSCRARFPWRRWRWRVRPAAMLGNHSSATQNGLTDRAPDQPARGPWFFHHQQAHPRRSRWPRHRSGRAS